MIGLIIFVAVSILIAVFSLASLRAPASHGFWRFFAFEGILGLVVLNASMWLADPLVWYQLLSWAALTLSAFLAIHGFVLLRRIGEPEGKREYSPNFAIENTTKLVDVGAYRYIRHPLYGSLLWFALGAFLKAPSLLGVVLLACTIAALSVTARVEEVENLRTFGAAYAAYMKRTKRFIPFVL